MDESDLFPGFGRPEDSRQDGRAPRRRSRADRPTPAPDAAAAPTPTPTPTPTPMPAGKSTARARSMATAPTRWIDHHDLAAPTLRHLTECPALAETASALVERCLASGRRFPHTLISGPADSSKRLIARAIAAEMAAPMHVVELVHVRDPDTLHASLRRIPAGAVALLSGAEAFNDAAMAALSRAIGAREPTAEPSMRDILQDIDREPWQRESKARSPRRYEDFTVILTARHHVAPTSTLHRWVELQFFTRRDGHTECARMARALRRVGIDLGPERLAEFAAFAATYRIRTTQAVNMLTVHLDAVRSTHAARDAAFAHAMDPTQVKRMQSLLRKIAA
jgi:hypothetical protein